MRITSIIVEDYKIARVALERMCSQHPSIDNVASFESTKEAQVNYEKIL